MRLAYERGHAIEVRGLTKTYDGGIEAVKGIDFEVAPGGEHCRACATAACKHSGT